MSLRFWSLDSTNYKMAVATLILLFDMGKLQSMERRREGEKHVCRSSSTSFLIYLLLQLSRSKVSRYELKLIKQNEVLI